MLSFSFNISWPWFSKIDDWQKDYFCKAWKVSKHKSIEVQLSKAGKSLLGFDFRWDSHCDHAGLMIELSLFRHFFIVHFYDGRHWNYEKDRYVNYDNPEEVEEYW
jgi:hypothetical protein